MLLSPAGRGILVSDGETKLCVDSDVRVPGATYVSTHAHTDHILSARFSRTFSTELTSMLARIKGFNLVPCDFNFLSAGHIPGSAQIFIENGQRVLITGDFKVETDILGERADVCRADVLVLETTFFEKNTVFPPRKRIYEKIIHFLEVNADRNSAVVFLAYDFGKAQEITALLNNHGLYPSTTREIYEANLLLGLKSELLNKEADVFVLPPKFSKYIDCISLSLDRKVVPAFLSGWSRRWPLSSHADFYQTLGFVEAVGPELVVTYGRNKYYAAEILKSMGYEAVPLDGKILL